MTRVHLSIAASAAAAALICATHAEAPAQTTEGVTHANNASAAENRGAVDVDATAQSGAQADTSAEEVALGARGTVTVNPDGTFSYQIPIEVPAGRRGVQPDLSILYNSDVRNGLLGVGFTLSGLPAIYRIAHDSGVRYAGGDTFVVNTAGWGVPSSARGRLVPYTDARGGLPARPADESWVRHEPVGTCGEGPCSWVASDGRGTTMVFGAIENAQLWERDAGRGQPGIRAWALTYVSDPFANAWHISYDKDAAMMYPRKVEYDCDFTPGTTTPWTDPGPTIPPPPPPPGDMIPPPPPPGWPTTTGSDPDAPYMTSLPTFGSGTSTIPPVGTTTPTVTITVGTTTTPPPPQATTFCVGKRSIDFIYQTTRADETRLPTRYRRLLVGIHIRSLGTTVRTYALAYGAVSPTTGAARLQSVQERGTDNSPLTAYPATTFGYTSGGSTRTQAAPTQSVGWSWRAEVTTKTLTGDINGDGCEDVVRVAQDKGYRRVEFALGCDHGEVPLRRQTLLEWTSAADPGKSGPGDLPGHSDEDWKDWDALLLDVNVDGRDDLVLGYAGLRVGALQIAHGNATGFDALHEYAHNAALSARVPHFLAPRHARFLAGDINGDQAADLLIADGLHREVIFVVSAAGGPLPPQRRVPPSEVRPGVWWVEPALADLNGDGRADIVFSTTRGAHDGVPAGLHSVTYYGSAEHGLSDAVSQIWPTGAVGWTPYQSVVGDFNADGYDDLALAFSGAIQTSIPTVPFGRDVRALLGHERAHERMWIREPFTEATTYATMSVPNKRYAAWEQQIGDFNGDGCADLAFAYAGYHGTRTHYAQSDCRGGFLPVAQLANGGARPDGTMNQHKWSLSALDLDGDGYDDLAAYYSGSGGSQVDVAYGRPSGLAAYVTVLQSAAAVAETTDVDDWSRAQSVSLHAADLNGDGKRDLILANHAGTLLELSTAGTPDLLASIANGYGGTVAITYQMTTFHPGAIRPGQTSCAAPAGDDCGLPNRFTRPVAVHVTTQDGRGLVRGQTYAYENGRYYPGPIALPPAAPLTDRKVRADLAFERIRKTDDSTGAATTTWYRQDRPFHQAVAKIEVEATIAPATVPLPVRRETFEYESGTTAAGTSYVRPQKRTSIQMELTMSTSWIDTYWRYSDHGAVVYEAECADGTCLETHTDLVPVDVATWLLALPRRVRVRSVPAANPALADATCAFGSCTLLSWDEYTYRADLVAAPSLGDRVLVGDHQSLLCKLANDCPCFTDANLCLAPGKGRWVYPEKNQTYDGHGNLARAEDALGRARTLTYDPDFATYVASETRGAFTTTWTYDAAGRVNLAYDSNGQKTDHDYDTLGRPSQIVRPNGRVETWQYLAIGTPTAQRVRHSETTAPGVSRWSDRYFDGHGQVYETRRQAATGYTRARREVRFVGPLLSVFVSLPHDHTTAEADVFWSETVHDRIGRPRFFHKRRGTVTNGTAADYGRLREIVYFTQGWIVVRDHQADLDSAGRLTATTRWQETRRRRDSRGNVTRVDDARGNSTFYEFDPAFRVEHVHGPYAPSEIIWMHYQYTEHGYDSFGRIVWQTSDATGLETMQYDDVGNLVKHTSRPSLTNTQLTKLVYDAYDRPVTKTNTDGVVTWVWDPKIVNGRGRLGSVTGPEVARQFLAYDASGNLGKMQVTIKGMRAPAVETYGHDLANRVTRRTLDNGTQLAYAYDAGSNLSTVHVNGLEYARFSDYTADGKPGSRTTLAGDTDWGFAPDGNLAWLLAMPQSGSWLPLQSVTYSFDSLGNLRNLTDGLGQTGSIVGSNTGETWSLAYDAQNQLVSATTGLFVTEDYVYDPRGNLVWRGDREITHNGNLVTANDITWYGCVPGYLCPRIPLSTTLAYRLDHDLAGSLVRKELPGGVLWDFGYDVDRRMVAATVGGRLRASYAYDADGERAKKTVHASDAVVTTYYISPHYELRESSLKPTTVVPTVHVDAPGHGQIATITGERLPGAPAALTLGEWAPSLGGHTMYGVAKGIFFLFDNHIGSSAVVTDATGTMVTRYLHGPWGDVLTARSGGTNVITDRYTGQESDDETDLLYYGARYYDPRTARFTTGDSVLPTGGYDVRGFNRYAYAFNNPMRYTDPTGHAPEEYKPTPYQRTKAIEDMRAAFKYLNKYNETGKPVYKDMYEYMMRNASARITGSYRKDPIVPLLQLQAEIAKDVIEDRMPWDTAVDTIKAAKRLKDGEGVGRAVAEYVPGASTLVEVSDAVERLETKQNDLLIDLLDQDLKQQRGDALADPVPDSHSPPSWQESTCWGTAGCGHRSVPQPPPRLPRDPGPNVVVDGWSFVRREGGTRSIEIHSQGPPWWVRRGRND
jgi:RHS repeat-associated protein